MSDIYLSIAETPTVVTLTNPLVSSAIAQSVTVTNVVSVNVVTMPAITVQAAAPAVTTVAGTVAVSNFPASSSVTIGGFSTSSLPPSTVTVGNTVTINGTVTANLPLNTDGFSGVTGVRIIGAGYDGGLRVQGINPQTFTGENLEEGGAIPVMTYDNQALSISGTVTANVDAGSLISALENFGQAYTTQIPVGIDQAGFGDVPISGTVTARLQDASGNNLTSTSIGGVQRLNVSLASAATAGGTLPSFINIHGGTDGSVARTMLLDSSGRTVVTVSNFPATQPVSLASTTVTVSALPSGALTTRFGSVTTANTAQMTSAVTNTSRKYLLAQNISAGTVTIGIGFSPTTTQGIQLPAGGGLTFDTFCPTGAVYWLGAVTGAAFTILEG